MSKPDLVGSWFNTGYHGHSRNKVRTDFMNEFRFLAKPQPPKTFYARLKQPMVNHPFTTHDNKHCYSTSASYFDSGTIGRKKFSDKARFYDPDFLAWFPVKPSYDASSSLFSTYKKDYHLHRPVNQLLVDRPKTSFDTDRMVTSYRYAYGQDAPNKEAWLKASGCQIPSNLNQKPRSKNSDGRESVASCMIWHFPRPPKSACGVARRPSVTRRMAPQATEITADASRVSVNGDSNEMPSVGAVVSENTFRAEPSEYASRPSSPRGSAPDGGTSCGVQEATSTSVCDTATNGNAVSCEE